MSEVERVAVRMPDGEYIVLPRAQAFAIHRLARDMRDPAWHFNECGCCVSLHERHDHHRGYVIGPDGGADWVQT